MGPAAVAPTTVGVLGAGVIGRVHRAVLEDLPGVAVTFTVDPASAGDDASAHRTLEEALESCGEPGLLVVATPTDTHLEVVAEALRTTGARVLCEKPLTRHLAGLERFTREHADELHRLRVVDHFGFAPEVVWAVGQVAERRWASPARVVSTFNDPYVLKTPAQRSSYVSSWVDSGANQLAVVMRFVDEVEVTRVESHPEGLQAVADLTHRSGSATLISSWLTGASSKQTSLRWSGEREVFLDHTAMTGYVAEDGEVLALLGNDGTVERKVAHYRPMYQALLSGDDALLAVDRASRTARLLAVDGESAG